jgi:hypothetical protein
MGGREVQQRKAADAYDEQEGNYLAKRSENLEKSGAIATARAVLNDVFILSEHVREKLILPLHAGQDLTNVV